GFTVAEHRYDDGKPDRRFGGGYYDDEYGEHRPSERIHREPLPGQHIFVELEISRERNQVQVDGVEDQFDRHDDDDDVSASQHTGDPHQEKKEAEQQEVYERWLEPLRKRRWSLQ